MTVGKQIFLAALSKIIEQTPSHKRMALLISLDLWRISGEPVCELEFVEAIVDGLHAEIAQACCSPLNQSEYMQ